MSKKIKLGIVGYGNLGKGAIEAIKQTQDMELVAVFTRRDPKDINHDDLNVTTIHISKANEYKNVKRDHSKSPHGGFVIRGGNTGADNKQIYEFSLKLDSNPEFTASVLVAYARAAYRLNQEKNYGAKSVFDVAPSYISPRNAEELRRNYL